MPSGRGAQGGGLATGVVLLALAGAGGCLSLDLPTVAPTPVPPTLTVLTPQPNDVISLTAQVSVVAESVNGISSVSVLCGPIDGGARTAYVWAAAPFRALVDFSPCQGLTELSTNGGLPLLPLSFRAVSDAGAAAEQDFTVRLNASGPTISALYPPTAQPKSPFVVTVTSDVLLSSAPTVLLGGAPADSVTTRLNPDGGVPLYDALFVSTPGLGTDNYDYDAGGIVPIEVLTDTDRLVRLTVDATALANGNAAHLDLSVELSRVVWDRYIPGQPAASGPTSWAAEPVAFAGGLVLPLATATPASAASAWIPGRLSRDDGTFFGFGGDAGTGYLARGISLQGETLFARPDGGGSEVLLAPPDGGAFILGTLPGKLVTPPITAVDNLLCLQDSVTACTAAGVESLTCLTPQLTEVTATSGIAATGPPTAGVVAGAGGRYLSPNVAVCGSSWNLVDLTQGTVSFGPLADPNGLKRNCQIQKVSKLLAVGDGTFVVQLTSSCGAAAVVLEYPILRVGAGGAILGAYTAPLGTARPVQLEVVAVLVGGRVVTLANEPPYTDFVLWRLNPTQVDVPDVITRIAGLYDTADSVQASVLAQSTYSASDGSFAVLLSGAQLGVGVAAFGPDLKALWLYLYPRVTTANNARLVSHSRVGDVYLLDEFNNRSVSLRVQPQLPADGG